MPRDRTLTEQLQVFFQGDQSGVDAILEEVLPRLHEIAVRHLNGEHHSSQVSATELIHELWLRSLSKAEWQIRNQGHFYAIASLAMRRVLVDLARHRMAQRRGGAESPLALDESASSFPRPSTDAQQIVEIGMLMERLDKEDPDAARMIDMHYFGGFSMGEIAESTKMTELPRAQIAA